MYIPFMLINMYMFIYIYVYVYIYICLCIYTYIHIYIYMYMCTPIYPRVRYPQAGHLRIVFPGVQQHCQVVRT